MPITTRVARPLAATIAAAALAAAAPAVSAAPASSAGSPVAQTAAAPAAAAAAGTPAARAAGAELVRSAADLFHYPGADVTLVNHRGLSPSYPENTLAAFRNAIAMGVDAIEIDLRATKDGEIVILHDDTVDRTTDGSGRVGDLTLAEVKALDAGSYESPAFAGERIPTYEETLQLLRGTGVRLLLDIKTPAVTERAVELTRRHGMIGDVIVGPRTVENLRAFKALDPDLTTLGFIATPADADAMIDAGVDVIRLWPDWIADSRDSADCRSDYAARVAAFERGERDHPGSASCLLEEVVRTGTPVWSTVNDLPYEGMDELIRLGATGILSDLPAELDRLLDDVDAQRLTAATGRVRGLAATLADAYSARSLLEGQARLLRELLRRPWEARAIAARSAQLQREFAQATQARVQLARVERRLRVGDRAGACGTLSRVAGGLEGLGGAPDAAWSAREAGRTLACA